MGDQTLMGGNRAAKEFTHILVSCTFGMMPTAFGPVLPATAISQLATKQIRKKTTSNFAREVPEGTRYVGEKCGRTPPISWHLYA